MSPMLRGIIISCLAPPPFPFGASTAVASAFQYPRLRLLFLVFGARVFRYSLVGWAAIYFGRRILRIANSAEFMWFMGGFITFCLIGASCRSSTGSGSDVHARVPINVRRQPSFESNSARLIMVTLVAAETLPVLRNLIFASGEPPSGQAARSGVLTAH
jgi:hypothetical protein